MIRMLQRIELALTACTGSAAHAGPSGMISVMTEWS